MSIDDKRLKKIAFFEIAAWERERLIKELGGFSLSFYAAPLDAEHLPADRDVAAISVGETSIVDSHVLSAFPRLELVLARGRNVSAINGNDCREKNVMICRVPGHAASAVAEFTFALILALSRKVHTSIKRGTENSVSLDGLQGFDLHGKAIGILGTGHIGSRVIRIARGFGMKVLAWNPKQNLQLAADLGFTYVSSDELLHHSDILTMHVPYVPEGKTPTQRNNIIRSNREYTHQLFNREIFSRMKRGALLINTSHPDIIDADALLWALGEGILAGAAIDGARGSSQKFSAHQNLIVTPGIAFNTIETHEHALRTTAENIRSFFRGFPQNVVGEKLSEVRDNT